MKKMTALAASILVVIASGQAMAGSTANLQVTGKLMPSACDITIAGAAEEGVAFGDIDIAKLNKYKPTELTDKAQKIAITVSCPEAAHTGIKFSDMMTANKAKSAFSLGYKNNVELGSFTLVLDPNESNIDGKPAEAMYLRNEHGLFEKFGGASAVPMQNSTVTTTAGFDISSTQDTRDAAKTKRFGLTVVPTINATNDIGNVQETTLSGIAAVDIIYL